MNRINRYRLSDRLVTIRMLIAYKIYLNVIEGSSFILSIINLKKDENRIALKLVSNYKGRWYNLIIGWVWLWYFYCWESAETKSYWRVIVVGIKY